MILKQNCNIPQLEKSRYVRGGNMRIGLSIGLAMCLVGVAPVFGQGVNATITGTVTDPGGLVIAAAPIEAKNLETGAQYAAATTSTGNYALPGLPVGSYV